MPLSEHEKMHALLIDLDGVLRIWPREDAVLETLHGLPQGALRATAFEPDLILDAIEGRISDVAWRQTVEVRLVEKYPKASVADAVRAWSEPHGTVNDPVLTLVREIRRKVPVVLVTNATFRLNHDLKALKLLDEFDAIINSSIVQSAKPNARIYEKALEAAGVGATEALFVDDQAINIAAAANLGINAHHFTSYEALTAHVVAVGLLHRAD